MRAYAYTLSTPVRNGVARVNALKVYRRRTVFTTETRRACGEVHAHVYTKTWMLGSRVLLGKSPIPARRTIPKGVAHPRPTRRTIRKQSRRQREGPYRPDEVHQSRGLATRPPHPNCVYVPVAIAGRVATAQTVSNSYLPFKPHHCK